MEYLNRFAEWLSKNYPFIHYPNPVGMHSSFVARTSSACSHALSGSHDLVHQQKLLRQCRSNVQPVLFCDVVVVDLLLHGGNGSEGGQVESHCQLAVLVVLVLEEDDGLLDVVATVFGKNLNSSSKYLRNHQKGFSKGLNAELGLSFHCFAVLKQVEVGGNLK